MKAIQGQKLKVKPDTPTPNMESDGGLSEDMQAIQEQEFRVSPEDTLDYSDPTEGLSARMKALREQELSIEGEEASVFAPPGEEEDEEGGIFGGVVEQQTKAPASAPDQNERSSQIASFLEVDLNAPSIIQEMQKLRNIHQRRFDQLGDGEWRKELALEAKAGEIRGLIDFSREASAVPEDPELAELAQLTRQAVSMKMEQSLEAKKRYAAEEALLKKFESWAIQGDVHQARAAFELNESGATSPLEQRGQRLIKRQMMDNMLSEMNIAKKDRGWVGIATDFIVGDMLNVIDGGSSSTGNIETDTLRKENFLQYARTFFFPSKRLEQEANAIYQMSNEEFAEAIPALKEALRRNSTWFGIHDEAEQYRLLQEIFSPPNAEGKNLLAVGEIALLGVDISTIKAGVKASKAARKTSRETGGADFLAKDGTFGVQGKAETPFPTLQGATLESAPLSGKLAGTVDSHLSPPTVLEKTGAPVPKFEGKPSKTKAVPFSALDMLKVPVSRTVGPLEAVVKMGGRKQGAEMISSVVSEVGQVGAEVAAKKLALTPVQLAEEVSVTFFRTESSVNDVLEDIVVPLADEADEAMERGAFLLKEGVNPLASRRLTPEEYEHRILTAEKEAADLFEKRPIKDVRVVQEHLIDGSSVSRTEVTLGQLRGGGYATKKGAQGVLRDQALAGEVFQDASGQWYAKAVLPIRETTSHYISPRARIVHGMLGMAARFGASSKNIGDRSLAGEATRAGSVRARTDKFIQGYWDTNIKGLSKKQSKDLEDVLIINSDNKKRYTPEELQESYIAQHGRGPSPKEETAYFAYQDIMDMDYAVRNNELHKKASLRGEEMVKSGDLFGPEGVTGRVDREFGTASIEDGSEIFDISAGTHYFPGKELKGSVYDNMKDQGYVRVKLSKAVKLEDGSLISDFIGRAVDFEVSPLKRNLLGYRGGPHREYLDKFFVKQAKTHKNPKSAKEFLASPRTFVSAGSRAEAQRWTDTMNRALQEWNRTGNVFDVEKVFDGKHGFPEAKAFVKDIQDGAIDPTHPFETLFDREMPSAYSEKTFAGRAALDERHTPLEGLYDTQGRMYYSKRGDRLESVTGDPAPILSPFSTLNRSAKNVSKIMGFSDYQIQAAERWVAQNQTFFKKGQAKHASAMSLLRDAEIDMSIPGAALIKDDFEAQREIVKRVLNHRTKSELYGERVNRTMLEWAGESKTKQKVVSWTENKNPLDAMRSFAFHTKLGLGNPGQWILQSSTAAQAAILAPKGGFKSLLGGHHVRFYSGHKHPDILAAEWKKKGYWKVFGYDSHEEFVDILNFTRRTGFLDVDASHMLINAESGINTVGKTGLGQSIKRGVHKSAFFFMEAEKFNRSVALQIAWKEAKHKGMKANIEDPEFVRKVMERADDYSFQMTKESAAAWQKGLTSIPTQFWSYQSRMMELMLGKTFSYKQRAALIGGQGLLYGSSGNAVTSFVSDKIKGDRGSAFETGSASWIADRGSLDALVHYLTGGDIAVGARIGVGPFLPTLIEDLTNSSQYGDVGFLDVALGAGWQIGGDGLESMGDLVKWMIADRGKLDSPTTLRAMQKVGANVSTVSNFTKGLYALNYGTYMSREGNTLLHDMPKVEAFALMVGLQPGAMDDLGAQFRYFKHKKEIEDDVAKIRTQLLQRWVNEPDNRADIAIELNTHRKIVPPEIWTAAVKKSRTPKHRSIAESMAQQMEKEKFQQDQIRRLKQRQKDK
jgi:hypothetical protein